MLAKVVCKNCGNYKYVYLCRVKNDRAKFCSRKCRDEYQTGNRKEDNVKVMIKCLMCGEEKEVFPTRLREGKGKFCSVDCLSEYRLNKKVEMNIKKIEESGINVNCRILKELWKKKLFSVDRAVRLYFKSDMSFEKGRKRKMRAWYWLRRSRKIDTICRWEKVYARAEAWIHSSIVDFWKGYDIWMNGDALWVQSVYKLLGSAEMDWRYVKKGGKGQGFIRGKGHQCRIGRMIFKP